MTARGRPMAPGLMRHGLAAGAGRGRLEPPELAAQVAEIERIVTENRRLAASIRAMRRDVGAAEDEIPRIKSHIRSTETESDIQTRVLLEKIGKMESGVKAGESIKKDLLQAHKEAQSLVAVRKELVRKIEQSSQELETYHSDIKNFPDMISELDNMRLEHQRLRAAFEHEKHVNVDLVERMQSMDDNLLAMSKEIETLKAEVLNAEKRAQAPNGGVYSNLDAQYPSLYRRNDPYYDPYRRAHVQTSDNGALGVVPPHDANNSPSSSIRSMPPVSGSVAPMAWGGAYDPNLTRN